MIDCNNGSFAIIMKINTSQLKTLLNPCTTYFEFIQRYKFSDTLLSSAA